MDTSTRIDALRQKAGGLAAFGIALSLIAAMPYFLLVVDYLSASTAKEKVALVVANYASMYGMYLLTYVFYGIALGVLTFALYDRMQAGAPATMRVAAAVGLLWAFSLVTSGLIFNYGMTTVVALNKTDPGQARMMWQSIEPVAQALGGAGGELLGGLWILFTSAVALRQGALPKLLGWFGLTAGVVGVLSVIPPLHDGAIVFGLALIVWFAWLGTVLMRTKATRAGAEAPDHGTASPVRAPSGKRFLRAPQELGS